MPDLDDNAYAAGLFDGEGCVQLYYRQSRHARHALNTALSVSGVDLRPLNWLRERWGGTITIYDGSRENRRAVGRWIIYSEQADRFAHDIRPFLLVKLEQVDLWLEARALMGRRGWRNAAMSDEEVAQREFLVQRVSDLKWAVHHS